MVATWSECHTAFRGSCSSVPALTLISTESLTSPYSPVSSSPCKRNILIALESSLLPPPTPTPGLFLTTSFRKHEMSESGKHQPVCRQEGVWCHHLVCKSSYWSAGGGGRGNVSLFAFRLPCTIRRFGQGYVTELLPGPSGVGEVGKSVFSELTSKGVVGRGLRGCELITAPQG